MYTKRMSYLNKLFVLTTLTLTSCLESPEIVLREDIPPPLVEETVIKTDYLVVPVGLQDIEEKRAAMVRESQVREILNYKEPVNVFNSKDLLFAEYTKLNPVDQEKFLIQVKKKYLSKEIETRQAIAIMKFFVEITGLVSEKEKISLLAQRVQLTRKESMPDIDAYSMLWTTVFPRTVSVVEQEHILAVVKKIWQSNEAYKTITASTLGNFFDKEMAIKPFKTYAPEIQQELQVLRRAIELSGDSMAIACIERNGHSLITAVGSGGE